MQPSTLKIFQVVEFLQPGQMLTHQVPVKVQVNDGKTVRLAMLERAAGRDGIRREQLMELTGQELVVLSRQLEIGEGVRVNAGLSDWPTNLA